MFWSSHSGSGLPCSFSFSQEGIWLTAARHATFALHQRYQQGGSQVSLPVLGHSSKQHAEMECCCAEVFREEFNSRYSLLSLTKEVKTFSLYEHRTLSSFLFILIFFSSSQFALLCLHFFYSPQYFFLKWIPAERIVYRFKDISQYF